jgi:trehalose 6-phosphate synthase/phosphatase
VTTAAEAIRREAGDRRIVLGVDRLDYTKGIPRRLQAIERLLRRQPELANHLRFIQLAVPSRGEVESYQRFRRQVEELVGRINGAHGTPNSTPVHYMHRSVSREELVALYRAADVMLVTPLRDGMNLVAKEFVASRVDDDGALVLSEFAGASAELDGAFMVNPYDLDAVADGVDRALSMSPAEAAARMKTLRGRVFAQDVHAWARGFIEQLESARPIRRSCLGPPEPALLSVLMDARAGAGLRLLLDYDGTLVPFARSPELAAPDDELMALLNALTASPDIVVDIVSGRRRDTLDTWFGELPISLWAEHGFWHRPREASGWDASAGFSPREWIARVKPILEQFTASTPGSSIEEKTASIAWHYRGAQREFGTRQAHELRMLLGDALSNQPLEVLEGKKVIEIRLRGVSKALVAGRVVDETPADVQIVAIGDDRTDEDLFRMLPASTVTVAVGTGLSRARYRLSDYRAVRRTLGALLDTRDRGHSDIGVRAFSLV